MRIIEVEQRSEAWDQLRARPTASEFKQFCTSSRCDYASGAKKYAAKVAMKKIGAFIPPPPSFAMEWGIEHEDEAKAAYTAATGREITNVGFVMPDETDAFGGSPDGLVGDNGLVEVKCPQAETLAFWALEDKLPLEHIPQIQGLLLITGRAWCDFYAWHPYPLQMIVRVEADEKYQQKILKNLWRLLDDIKAVEQSLFGAF